MSGMDPTRLNLAIYNLMNMTVANAGVSQVNPTATPASATPPKPQDPTLPDLGLAGTPFNSNASQPLTVGLLGTPVKQMDAQDAVSLGGRGSGSNKSAGESSGEGAGNAGNSGRSRRASSGEGPGEGAGSAGNSGKSSRRSNGE